MYPLLFKLEVWDVHVLHTNRKVGSMNPTVVLLFPYDPSFKVNLKVKGQTYENHQISPLLFKLEVWDVLLTNRKVGSRNPMRVLLFPYDLSFKVNTKVKVQTCENHEIFTIHVWCLGSRHICNRKTSSSIQLCYYYFLQPWQIHRPCHIFLAVVGISFFKACFIILE